MAGMAFRLLKNGNLTVWRTVVWLCCVYLAFMVVVAAPVLLLLLFGGLLGLSLR